jgi:peptidoglycan/xylan/chitin deacetylase (PgdA/CDA1 family)
MNRATVAAGVIGITAFATYGIVQAGWSLSKALMGSAKPEPSATAAATPAPPRIDALAAATLPPALEVTGSVRPGTAPPASTAPAPPPAMAPSFAAPPTTAAPRPAAAQKAAAAPKPVACTNPNAMGLARTVEIDTTGGPGFGSQHFKNIDFLEDHEVVLTFDDGPWLGHTPAVLKALADQCVKATFFAIGKHSTFYPAIIKQVVAAGHTVGSHTWSHADLLATVKKGGPDAAKEEIEKGFSGVHLMADAPIAPFFRFPDLRHPPEMMTYLGERNVASFSTDIDSWDYKIKKPEELTRTLMIKIQKAGKGIILMHDFQKVTSIALPQILEQLQKNGFKVVHMIPKGKLDTLPQYDEAVLKENKLPTLSNASAASVVRTVAD